MPLFSSPVVPWIIDGGCLAVGNSSAVLAANTVYVWAFEIYAPTPITGMRWRMAATTTGNSDAGIYDSGGNLLAHTGATANVANTQNTASFSSVLNLSPGRYYQALTPSNSTDTYNRASNIQVGSSPNPITRAFTAVNSGSAGVLPSALGGVNAASNMPDIAAAVQGGL